MSKTGSAHAGPRTETPAATDNEKGDRLSMDRYVCTVCGYVYDPEQGDPDNGIAPGTSFDDLPETWECPNCGAPKSDFERMV